MYKRQVYSNALGIPIVAFIQGIVGLVGYWIFGVEEFLLMGILTAISSVIPIIGTLAIYLPLAIFQFAVVSPWQGIGVALWGFIVIGSVDNIARFLVQKMHAKPKRSLNCGESINQLRITDYGNVVDIPRTRGTAMPGVHSTPSPAPKLIGSSTVSYTHLDVYKRQSLISGYFRRNCP